MDMSRIWSAAWIASSDNSARFVSPSMQIPARSPRDFRFLINFISWPFVFSMWNVMPFTPKFWKASN